MTQHTRPQRADSCMSFVGDFNLRNNRHTPSYHFPMHILPGSKAQKLKRSKAPSVGVSSPPLQSTVRYDIGACYLQYCKYNHSYIVQKRNCKYIQRTSNRQKPHQLKLSSRPRQTRTSIPLWLGSSTNVSRHLHLNNAYYCAQTAPFG